MKIITVAMLGSVLIWMLVLFGLTAWAEPAMVQPESIGAGDDGMTADERAEIYGTSSGSGSLCARAGTGPDLIIVDTTRPVAFFGLYRANQMTAPGWDLYERTVDWANGFNDPANTTVWLATYNGTLDPKYSAELGGIAVYDYLVNSMGFLPANIHVDAQNSIETGDFTGYDIVLYTWAYPRDATNVMTQDKPYVTFSTGQTDELGIGTGATVMHDARNYGYIIENAHHITATYSTGKFTLASSMWMDATEVAGNGRLLAKAEVQPLEAGMVTLSAATGGMIHFYLDAGAAHGLRNYFILASVTGTSPGTTLPGGLTLPLNWDVFTDLVLLHAGGPLFPGFLGNLDIAGLASAKLNAPPLPVGTVGVTMAYAYLFYNPFDFVSNTAEIDIVP